MILLLHLSIAYSRSIFVFYRWDKFILCTCHKNKGRRRLQVIIRLYRIPFPYLRWKMMKKQQDKKQERKRLYPFLSSFCIFVFWVPLIEDATHRLKWHYCMNNLVVSRKIWMFEKHERLTRTSMQASPKKLFVMTRKWAFSAFITNGVKISGLCVFQTFFRLKLFLDFICFRTYYFYEFGNDDQHAAIVAAVNSGKVCLLTYYDDSFKNKLHINRHCIYLFNKYPNFLEVVQLTAHSLYLLEDI